MRCNLPLTIPHATDLRRVEMAGGHSASGLRRGRSRVDQDSLEVGVRWVRAILSNTPLIYRWESVAP